MEWVIAGLTVFGTVASVTGVVLYVFNGTKKLIEKIDERTAKMEEEFIKLDERFAKLDERAEERHQEVIALLKRLTDLIEMRIPIPNSATNPGTTKRKKIISRKSKKR